MAELHSNATAKAESPITIALAKWDGCDTYTDCPVCGPHHDEAPYMVLKRGRVYPFEVALDGTLAPICQDCAEKHSPDLAALISGGCVFCDVSPHQGGGMFWDNERWICSECWDRVVEAFEEARAATLRQRIVIKDNNCATNDPCAICGDRTDPAIGPELFLDGTWALVCHHNCGKTVPGLLDRLKEMQKVWWDEFRQRHGIPAVSADATADACECPF